MKVIAFILALCAIAIADNPTRYQWTPGFVFNGGINITSDKGQLEANQLLDANNFIWRDNQLQVREGFYRFVSPLTAQPTKFMDIFRNTDGEAYLLYSDGTKLWYRSGLTTESAELNFGRSNRGIVDTWATVVGGDSVAVQKWRAIFGTGEGLTITIGSTDYTVNKILLDTLLYVTSTAGTTTDQAYNIDYSAVTVQDGVVMSDNYWIYSNVGKFYFNRPDSFVVADSLAGLRYSYSAVSRRISPTHSLLFSATGVSKNYAGQFLRITTNPFSAGGAKNPVTGGHPYYMSYPVRTSGSNQVSTYASPFQPDSLPDQYFTIEALVYDSTTRVVYTVDSVRLIAADSANFYSGGGGGFGDVYNASYLKIYDTDFDSTTFITGDWFFFPRYNFSDQDFSYDSLAPYSYLELPTTVYTTYPVVGGFKSTDGAIYVACPGLWTRPRDYSGIDIDTNNVAVTFYRMKKNVSGSRSAGLRFARLYQDRVFTARDTMCNQLEWSEPFLPDSSFATSVMIINSGDGQCITAAEAQYADLIVYMPDSRWKIFGDGTNAGYGKERMNGSVGCVAKGSLLNIDNNHFFLHSTGYYTSNGDAPVLISGAVNKYFTDSINTNEYDKVASGYDLERGNIWISFPRIGATTNTITLVYNIATQSWWREGINAASYYYNPDLEVSDSVRFLVGKTDSSTVLVRGRDKDDGANIDAYVRTGYLDFGAPDSYKRLEKFHLRHNVVSTCDSIVQATYVDTVTTALPSVSYVPAATWSDRRVTFRDEVQIGERFSLKWTLYDAGKTTLPHLSLRFWVGSEGE